MKKAFDHRFFLKFFVKNAFVTVHHCSRFRRNVRTCVNNQEKEKDSIYVCRYLYVYLCVCEKRTRS